MEDTLFAIETKFPGSLKRLHDAGVTINLQHSSSGPMRVSGDRPRGYSAGATFLSVPGYFSPSDNSIVINTRVAGSDGKWTTRDAKDTGFTAAHEVGHALDEVLGELTNGDPYSLTYQRESTLIGGESRKELSYFLQDGEAGREETFAEGFEVLVLGEKSPQYKEFCDHFPRLLEVMHGTLAETFPDHRFSTPVSRRKIK